MSKLCKLESIAKIDISNVDKKTKDNEKQVILCNFVDVYHNWIVTQSTAKDFMRATANENQIERFSIHVGQVAMTKDSETRDDIGVPTYIADEIPNAVLGYHCALITPDESILDGAYLNVILHTPYAQKYFEANASGSGQRYTLTIDIIGGFPVPLVDLEKQKRISKIFSDIDSKIANNNAICADLENMAKLLYDYWFVQFDFPDENGKPYKSSGGKMVWNEELKREIPEGWEVKTFADILSFSKGKIPTELSDVKTTEANSPYITIDVANGGLPQFCNSVSMVSCDGETIMVMDGAASGDVYVGNYGSLGSTFSKLPSKRSDITNSLIYMLLKGYMVVYKNANTGSTVPHANRSFIEKLKIALPNDCSWISGQFDLIIAKQLQAKTENQQLASLRDFLLPMLMNGQVRVGTADSVENK